MGNKFCDCGGQSSLLDAGPPGQRKRSEFFQFNLTPIANGHGADSSHNLCNVKELLKSAKATLIINMGGT